VPWNFFANSLARGTGSLVGSAGLISKVYFPRLLIPVASVLAGVVDLAVVLLALLGVMLVWGVTPSWTLALLPLILILTLALSLGASLGLAAINVRYRDVGYMMPVVLQLWLYATPVIYSASLIPSEWRWLYGLNPMVGVIGGFRWALFGTGAPPLTELAFSSLVALILLIIGTLMFNHLESGFADVV
jgi:lipopolysaccharide transport system permease protein